MANGWRGHVLRALVLALSADAVVNVLPNAWMDREMEHLRVPSATRYLLATCKAAGATGLVFAGKRPSLGRLAARALVLYFVCAVAAHVRIKDEPRRYGPAVVMLGWSAVAERSLR